MSKKISIGDRVAYSAQFLRSIGCYGGDMAHARGTVSALLPFGERFLATIEWDLPDIPAKVVTANLAKVGTSAMNAQ